MSLGVAALDDNAARLSAFLCSAWMHSGLVYRERETVYQWDVIDRATRLWCLRGQDRYLTARIWLDAAHERRKAAREPA